jgi:hypothetical protein
MIAEGASQIGKMAVSAGGLFRSLAFVLVVGMGISIIAIVYPMAMDKEYK